MTIARWCSLAPKPWTLNHKPQQDRKRYTAHQVLPKRDHKYRDWNDLNRAVLRKSILIQICQLIIHMGTSKGYVDGFVRELTFTKPLYEHLQ